MSIQNDIKELKDLNIEIKRLYSQVKGLKLQAKTVEKRITDFLIEKNQIGLKHQDTAIVLDHKEKRSVMTKTEREDSSVSILQRYGIDNPKDVLNELLESRKGVPTEITKLKITKIKNK